MTLRHALLARICACLAFTALTAATQPAQVHEARQGPISSTASPIGTPGPVSLETTTMSRTTSSTTTTHVSSSSATSSSHSVSETSSATPQPSSSPGVLNLVVHNMTTCTSSVISWGYTGSQGELLLSVASADAGTSSSLARFKTRQSTNGTIQQLLTDTKTSSASWTWSAVNVTQGWYQIQGLVIATQNVSGTSGPFYVVNGTNVACLTSTSSQASSTPSPTPTVSSASDASKSNVTAIVGGVVGAFVGVALAVIAGICLWSRGRKRPLFGHRHGKKRKWGSLTSANSSIQPGGGEPQPTHGHSDSMAGVLQDAAGGKTSATPTPGDSDEDAGITREEKPGSPVTYSGMTPLDVLNTPVHYTRHTPSHYPVPLPTPTASESSRSRSASLHTSIQSIEQQAQRILSSLETPTRRRSERLSMPTLPPPTLSRFPHSPTHAPPKEEYPLSSVTAAPANRSISTGAVSMNARRTSRKPVPQYDPSLLEDSNADSVSTFTAGAESSQSHGTGMGTGASGTPADLVHKASFGNGGPVHYLIPDMPLPQQD